MVKVIAHRFLKPEAIEKAWPLFQELVEKTRQEDGCIEYDLFVDENDSGHFTFVETWRDQDALTAHGKSAHFTTLLPAIEAFARQDGLTAIMKKAL